MEIDKEFANKEFETEPTKMEGSGSESDEIDLFSSEDESKKSLKNNQDALNEKLRTLSQSTSINGYASDLFEESSDDEKVTKKGDYDLGALFGVSENDDGVNHDLTTAEGDLKINTFSNTPLIISKNINFLISFKLIFTVMC
jgi:hypothetical protein